MDNCKVLQNSSDGKLRINKTVFHFQRDRLPPARSFYELELGKLTRPNSKGWALGRCPFHESKSGKSFSVNLDSGGFYCFGCDAKGGDLVSFLRLRDGLSFQEACVQLGCWDVAGSAVGSSDRTREQAAQRKESERRERIEARDHLHAVQTLYEEAIAEHDWQLMPEFLPRVRQAEEHYAQLAGLDLP